MYQLGAYVNSAVHRNRADQRPSSNALVYVSDEESESGETSPGTTEDLETVKVPPTSVEAQCSASTANAAGESSSSLAGVVPPQDESSWAYVSTDPYVFEDETLETCEGTADAVVYHSDSEVFAEHVAAAEHSSSVTHSVEAMENSQSALPDVVVVEADDEQHECEEEEMHEVGEGEEDQAEVEDQEDQEDGEEVEEEDEEAATESLDLGEYGDEGSHMEATNDPYADAVDDEVPTEQMPLPSVAPRSNTVIVVFDDDESKTPGTTILLQGSSGNKEEMLKTHVGVHRKGPLQRPSDHSSAVEQIPANHRSFSGVAASSISNRSLSSNSNKQAQTVAPVPVARSSDAMVHACAATVGHASKKIPQKSCPAARTVQKPKLSAAPLAPRPELTVEQEQQRQQRQQQQQVQLRVQPQVQQRARAKETTERVLKRHNQAQPANSGCVEPNAKRQKNREAANVQLPQSVQIQSQLQLKRLRPEGSNTNPPKAALAHEAAMKMSKDRKRMAITVPPPTASPAHTIHPQRPSSTLSVQKSASLVRAGEICKTRTVGISRADKESKVANVKSTACPHPTAVKRNNGGACLAPASGNASFIPGGIQRHPRSSTGASAACAPWRNDGRPQQSAVHCQPPLQAAAPPPWHSLATPPVKKTEVVVPPRAKGLRPDAQPPKFVPAGKAPDWQQSNKRPAASKHVPAPKLSQSRAKTSAATTPLNPQAPDPLSVMPIPCDNEGRPFDLQRVVVNFANVGSTYGERVLKRDKNRRQTLMDYEGVRRCLQHLTQKHNLKVIGVIYENFKAVNEFGKEFWAPPNDIIAMCESIELAPRVTGSHHRSVDDEMTIKCAYNRNCRFLDNDNYVDWLTKMPNEGVRKWLESCQEFLQMRYYFDTGLGKFDTLDGNLPVQARLLLPQRPGTSQASSARTV